MGDIWVILDIWGIWIWILSLVFLFFLLFVCDSSLPLRIQTVNTTHTDTKIARRAIEHTLSPNNLLLIAPRAFKPIFPIHGILILKLLQTGTIPQKMILGTDPTGRAQIVTIRHLGTRYEPTLTLTLEPTRTTSDGTFHVFSDLHVDTFVVFALEWGLEGGLHAHCVIEFGVFLFGLVGLGFGL